MLYLYARLPRAGLANKLFPWARSRVYHHANGLPVLGSSWTQFAMGPWLRGERDKRTYLGTFRDDSNVLGKVKRQIALISHRNYPEMPDGTFDREAAKQKNGVLVFHGLEPYFNTLLGWAPTLKTDLLHIVHPSILRKVKEQAVAPISIHVRRGDFTLPLSEEDFQKKGAVRTPLAWFEQSLAWVRRNAGHSLRALVFSDADSGELATLLALPNVQRVSTGTAIGDLLSLSRSPLIIGSGGSSFSSWAAFLGNSSLITIPGQSPTWFGLTSQPGRYVGEFSCENPPPAFESQISNQSIELSDRETVV